MFAAALALDALPAAAASPPRYQPLPRFPSVQRDMAFSIADPALAVAAVQAAIGRAAGPLLREVDRLRRLPPARRRAQRGLAA